MIVALSSLGTVRIEVRLATYAHARPSWPVAYAVGTFVGGPLNGMQLDQFSVTRLNGQLVVTVSEQPTYVVTQELQDVIVRAVEALLTPLRA